MTTATVKPSLTPRQREILRFVIDFWGDHGAPPAIREIAAHFGISSPNGVACHLRALDDKGYIEWARDKKSRGACVPDLLAAARAAADRMLEELK